MDEEKKAELLKVKAIGELMINHDADMPAEYSAGIINAIGNELMRIVDIVIDE